MAPDAAVQQPQSTERASRKKAEKEPMTVEVEIKGRKVQARKQTVQTGAGSVTRFFGRLLG
jgi:hypothetical protein